MAALAVWLGQWRLSRDRQADACRAPPRGTTGRFPAQAPEIRCRFPARNPGVVADGRLAFASPIHVDPSPGRARDRAAFGAFVDRRLARHPGLRGLARAVWLGDADALPGDLFAQYREGGLLHLLALSGQHVASLWLVFRAGLGVACAGFHRSAGGRELYAVLPGVLTLLAAGLLAWLNPGNEPMARAAAMLGFFALVRARGFSPRSGALAAGTVAVLLLAGPSRMASDSFGLSAGATLLLCAWIDRYGMGFRQGVLLTLAMPVLLVPAGAFFFAGIAPMAPINGLCLGAAWSLVWIPLGFLVPFLPALPLPLFEAGWNGFIAVHHAAAPFLTAGYRAVPRPDVVEFAVLQFAVVAAVFSLPRPRRAAGHFLK